MQSSKESSSSGCFNPVGCPIDYSVLCVLPRSSTSTYDLSLILSYDQYFM